MARFNKYMKIPVILMFIFFNSMEKLVSDLRTKHELPDAVVNVMKKYDRGLFCGSKE